MYSMRADIFSKPFNVMVCIYDIIRLATEVVAGAGNWFALIQIISRAPIWAFRGTNAALCILSRHTKVRRVLWVWERECVIVSMCLFCIFLGLIDFSIAKEIPRPLQCAISIRARGLPSTLYAKEQIIKRYDCARNAGKTCARICARSARDTARLF